MKLRSTNTEQVVVVVGFALVLSITLQWWAGKGPIYDEMEEERSTLHNAILNNELPPGISSWTDLGGNSAQRRRVAVVTAQFIHEQSGLSLRYAHFLQDSIFLFLTFILLFIYLRRWLSPTYALMGLLYLGAVGLLTYQYWYFHPWDRMSQVVWLLGLMAVAAEKPIGIALAVTFGMAVKEDIAMLPVLYAMTSFDTRLEKKVFVRRMLVAVGLIALAFATRMLMSLNYPAQETNLGFSIERIERLFHYNFNYIRNSWVLAWPPILFWSIPLGLGLRGYRQLDPFHRRHVLWVVMCIAVLGWVGGGWHEVRNQVGFLFALMPSCLLTLRQILDAETKR